MQRVSLLRNFSFIFLVLFFFFTETNDLLRRMLFLFLLLQIDALEGVIKAGSTMSELGFEGIVETFDGLGQGGSLGFVAVLLFEVLAVGNGILITAGKDVRSGVVGVLRIFLENRILVEDEVPYSVDGELTAVGLDEFGFIFCKGFNTCDISLDGFLLDTKGA